MGTPLRQTNFSAGELDSLVQGRSDLPIFAKGAKTMRNMVPLKGGAVMSRPGSTLVAQVKEVASYREHPGIFGDLAEPPARPVRLERFIFSDTESYLLELGERYIRFHTLGRTVELAGAPYEVTQYLALSGATLALPIIANDLWKLRFAQLGNVVTITGPHFMPLELRRLDTTSWSVTETDFSPPAPVLPDVGDSYFTNPFNIDAPTENIITTPFVVVTSSVGADDDDHPAREWIHAFTAIMQHRQTGVILESLATVVRYEHPDGAESWPPVAPVLTELTSQQFPIYFDRPLTLKRLATAGALDPEYKTIAFRIYRGAGDVFGWIGDTRTREFIDLGQKPDYARQPPLGFEPFRRKTSPVFIERPASVGFFEERRVFGGGLYREITDFNPQGNELGRPGTVFFSATGDYYNFDERLAIHVQDEAMTFELASDVREAIRHLVPLERLVILTDNSAWTMAGHQGSPLLFNNVNARRTDAVGCSDVKPLVVDSCVLFIRNKGKGARLLVPVGREEKPYDGVDASEFAGHLFRGRDKRVVDWAYQEDPFGLIWAPRADGVLLSLTFSRERNVVAWARHDSEAGAAYGEARYESVCTVPEGEEDAVYAVVNRVVRTPGDIENQRVRYIERFTSRERRVLETDPNPENVDPADVTPEDTDTLYPTDVCLDCAIIYRGVPTRQITGLEEHAHKTVWVNARGSPPLTGTVDEDGVLDIDEQQLPALPPVNAVDENGIAIWVAHVGLAYQCDLESLAVVNPTTSQKTITEVGFELDQSKGVKAGQSFARLATWKQRRITDAFGVISAASELLYTPVSNAWDKTARVCLRQSLPLPVTVLGITREVE
jgi:hypothetical protein